MVTTQLLILGNGFDLHCGLKSSYNDFFRNRILDATGERYDTLRMKVGVSGFWEELLLQYYAVYGKKDYRWCDIETIIRDTLWLICFGRNEESTSKNKGFWLKALNSAVSRRNPPTAIAGMEDPIERYVFMYCFHFFYNLEREACVNNNDMLPFLLSNILQELHAFEKRFCKYIRDNIINPQNEKELNTNYIVNAVNLLAQITGFSSADFQDMDDIIDTDEDFEEEEISLYGFNYVEQEVKKLSHDFRKLSYTNILSFNYTNIFDILGVKSPCLYSNVHGKLCSVPCTEGCKVSSLIFGIDDTLIPSKDLNSELRLFSKTYRKMMDTNAPISILPPRNNRPIEIKFYGHSLSEADYSYFQSIFDYFDLYSNYNISLVFYYSKGHEQHDAIYRLINSYGRTLANKDQGKNLMHKLLLENRLKIIELLENVSN